MRVGKGVFCVDKDEIKPIPIDKEHEDFVGYFREMIFEGLALPRKYIDPSHPEYPGNKNATTYEEPYRAAQENVKEILTAMNGLSEEGFNNRIRNDPYFRRGFDIFVNLFMQAKFDE